MHPTQSQFSAYSLAYDYFNKPLFDGQLPRCLLNFSRKDKRVRGFFSPNRWESGGDETHEISLNPELLKRPLRDVMGTLVHEMTHLWQQEYGSPSRTGYHNREWGDKMEEVGLHPSHTGEPGGKRVGQRMSHYIIEGGLFDLAFAEMPASCKMHLVSGGQVAAKVAPKAESKVRHACPSCKQNAWGKPRLLILCAACQDESGAYLPMKAG